MSDPCTTLVHATSIAWDRRGALLLGAPGAGKSALALQMIALGCQLVSDDQTQLEVVDGALVASAPGAISGQIEARGFGILTLPARPNATICCAVQLDKSEINRLPEPKQTEYCGIALRLFHNCGKEVLPYALLQYLKGQPLLPL